MRVGYYVANTFPRLFQQLVSYYGKIRKKIYFVGENQIQSSIRPLVNLLPFPDCLAVHLRTALNLLHPQKEAPYGSLWIGNVLIRLSRSSKKRYQSLTFSISALFIARSDRQFE